MYSNYYKLLVSLSFILSILFYGISTAQNYTVKETISGWAPYWPNTINYGDIDNDGDIDVISSAFGDDLVVWYENLGNYRFSPQYIISDEVNGPRCIQVSDLDQDGDLDIISGSWTYADYEISWFENFGDGTFSSKNLITTDANGVIDIQCIDLDNDGDIDILAALMIGWNISWYENLGGENFDYRKNIDNIISPVTVYANDIDGDGDNDILSTEAYYNDLFWYENQGDGVFSSKIFIDKNIGVNKVKSEDLDNDNFNDVIITGSGDKKIAWYKNLGNGSFDSLTIISSDLSGNSSFYICDLDGDGDTDIGASSSSTVSWIENLSNGNSWQDHVVLSEENGSGVTIASDITQDGKRDIILASYDNYKVVYFENLGERSFSNELFISGLRKVNTIYSEDLDNDGDQDILAATSNAHQTEDKVVWFENIQNTGFEMQKVLTYDARGVQSVISNDIDLDGDYDVLYAGYNDSSIAWIENLGNGNFNTKKIIDDESDNARLIKFSDINNDGVGDVIFHSHNNKISWCENLGSQNFSDAELIADNTGSLKNLFIFDLDNDGDNDVLTATFWDDYIIAWYENQGSGIFGPKIVIDDNTDIGYATYIADLDNDNDIDIIDGFWGLYWYENLGSGNFAPRQLIDNDIEVLDQVYADDMNADGHIDIIAGVRFDDSVNTAICYYENLGDATFAERIITHDDPYYYTALITSDIDGDGENDILTSKLGNIGWFKHSYITKIEDHSELEFKCYPNPFSSYINISYELKKNTNVRISIFNCNGQKLEILVDQHQNKGKYSLNWKPLNYPNGIYFISTETKSSINTEKLILNKL